MSKVYAFEGLVPVIKPGAFVHPDAVLIGDVVIGTRCFIGPCAVLRGDFGRIEIHDGANVQDNCVIHSFPGRSVVVEEDGHIGHAAVVAAQAVHQAGQHTHIDQANGGQYHPIKWRTRLISGLGAGSRRGSGLQPGGKAQIQLQK